MLTMIRLFLCLAALPALLEAHETERLPRVPVVTASGEAVINVEPDQAEIDVGVVTQARTAPDAAKENAAKLARVIAALKKQLGKNDEVKTAGYSLTPNYRYPREGGKPEITGYTATNVVRVRTANLDHVGKLIDAAMQAGANRVNRLVFTVQDEQGAQLQALRIASTKARAKAEAIAGALGLQIARVISVA
ncbi:MAG TPA: SIMPL domain-containing protein, partial [Candidatus Binatia bacterium]|nr:SIMPL domain-containing protein [Candidatus Binatia bacterium]